MKAGGGLTMVRMVELGGVSRARCYRYDDDVGGRAGRDMVLGDAIQRIALEWPSYGRPRITAALRRQGWRVNPKRVYRLLREDNLLCIRKRKFQVTTDSDHGRRVYPNLAGQMSLTGINQLWVADITYIRLETEFVYLAVVIDAFSRRVIGWALDRTVEDELTLTALRMALELRRPPAGWVHHSDRRTQRALGMEKLRERRSAAGSHPDPRGGGENAGWRAGGWLGSERRAGPARAGTWRPTDLRCSSPAAESAPEYAIAAYNSGRSWWPLRRWLG